MKKEMICALLSLAPEQYAAAVYISGVDFLKLYTSPAAPASPLERGRGVSLDAITNQLLATRAYWKWYTTQFEIIDEAFLYKYVRRADYYDTALLHKLWQAKHEATKMIAKPPIKLFDVSYSEMFEKAMWEDLLTNSNTD